MIKEAPVLNSTLPQQAVSYPIAWLMRSTGVLGWISWWKDQVCWYLLQPHGSAWVVMLDWGVPGLCVTVDHTIQIWFEAITFNQWSLVFRLFILLIHSSEHEWWLWTFLGISMYWLYLISLWLEIKRKLCVLHQSLILLSLLFSFRHLAEHRIHPRSEIKKESVFLC